jgi:hypothetical protein
MAAGRWGSRAAAASAPSPARASAGSPRDTSTVIRTLWPVKEQPGHADQRELARIRHEHWGLAPGRLCHLPVGIGDHHGELTGAAGGRWLST